jgi:hypothetical protein
MGEIKQDAVLMQIDTEKEALKAQVQAMQNQMIAGQIDTLVSAGKITPGEKSALSGIMLQQDPHTVKMQILGFLNSRAEVQVTQPEVSANIVPTALLSEPEAGVDPVQKYATEHQIGYVAAYEDMQKKGLLNIKL